MIKTAKRLQSVEEYYFSKKLKEVKKMTDSGLDVINLGIGSPDLLPPKSVIDKLIETSKLPLANKYQSYNGTQQLREAISKWYKNTYEVELNPENEILPLLGSKEGIMHISQAYLEKEDEVLVPNPGYLTYTSVTNLLEAKPVYYPLDGENNWQPNWSFLESLDYSNIKIMWVNYPHMPTGARADEKTFKKLINLAEKENFLLINDNPYSLILNDKAESILKYSDGSKHVLELNSLSKIFNMAGWRVGMLSGDAKNISNVLKVKSNMDSGMYLPVQLGAVEALSTPIKWIKDNNKIYSERRKIIWKLCDKWNLKYDKNTGGLFVWAKLPEGMDEIEYCDDKLYNENLFITPGNIFGSEGKGYVRFSLCAPVDDLIHKFEL